MATALYGFQVKVSVSACHSHIAREPLGVRALKKAAACDHHGSPELAHTLGITTPLGGGWGGGSNLDVKNIETSPIYVIFGDMHR